MDSEIAPHGKGVGNYFEPDLRPQTYIHRIGVSDHEQPIGHYSPNKHTIEQIPYFSSLLTEEDDVLVHCWAGKSRSTAAVLVILYDKLRDYQKARESLLRIRPQAAPNRLICRLADTHFNYVRDGEAQAKNSVDHLYNIADEIGKARRDDKAFDGS